MKAKTISIIVTLALVISLISFLAPPSASPVRAVTTWYVNPGESIQAAVDAASSGDTIVVRDGTYVENVVVNKSVVMRSGNGPSNTTVQGTTGNILWVRADNVTIEGFTVTGTFETHGILVDSVRDCHILSNICQATDGGIVLHHSSGITAKNNVCSGNQYCGIQLGNSWDCLVEGNTCCENLVRGIEVLQSSNNTVQGNTCSRNGETGVVLSDSSGNTLSNNTISLNSQWAMWVWKSLNNTVFCNDFIGSQVFLMDASSNAWNSADQIGYTYNGGSHVNYLGNYWSNYSGTDANADGIGDTPYFIGTESDHYPLVQPFEDYTSQLTAQSAFGTAVSSVPAVGWSRMRFHS